MRCFVNYSIAFVETLCNNYTKSSEVAKGLTQTYGIIYDTPYYYTVIKAN